MNLDGVRRALDESIKSNVKFLGSYMEDLKKDLQTAHEYFGAESEEYARVNNRYLETLETAVRVSNLLGEHQMSEKGR